MHFKLSNPSLQNIKEFFDYERYGDFEDPPKIYCSRCGGTIWRGEEFYEVDGKCFCMKCEDAAEERILELHRDKFIYEW